MTDLREQLLQSMRSHFDGDLAAADCTRTTLAIVQPIIDTLTAQNAALMAERDAHSPPSDVGDSARNLAVAICK